jgi:GTP-binding protein
LKDVREGLGLKSDDIVIPFSAQTKQGREEIWDLMEKISSAEGTTEK